MTLDPSLLALSRRNQAGPVFLASELTMDSALLVRHPDAGDASYSFVAYSDEIEAVLLARYGRRGLCLKVFPPGKQRKKDAIQLLVSVV